MAVTNKITYDTNVISEPTFSLLSSGQSGIRYSYNAQFDNSKNDPSANNYMVDHQTTLYVELVNTGSTNKTFEFSANMQPVKSCQTISSSDCVHCLGDATTRTAWSKKSSLCFSGLSELLPSMEALMHVKHCQLTQPSETFNTTVESSSKAVIIPPGGITTLNISNTLVNECTV